MNSYLANILHRHSGTDSLVTPRLRSRFETEDVGSAKPMSIHHPDMVETQEVHQAGNSRTPENHSAAPATDPIESQRIDPKERRPAAPSEPVIFREDHVQPRDGGIRSTADESISVGEDVTDVEPRNDTPASQQLSREPLRAEPNRQTHPEVKMPVDLSKPVEAGGDPWGRRDDLIQPIMNNSVSVEAKPAEMDPPYDKPLLQQQDRQPVAARPVEQTRSLENDTLYGLIQRNSTSETKKDPARTANLPENVSTANLPEKPHAQPFETGPSFDHELDNRINIMLARLQDNQKIHSTEHAETKVSDRLMDTKPDHAGETEKERAAQSLLAAHSFDQSKKLSLPDTDQEQQFVDAPDHRDRSSDSLLWPPAWLSEVQTQFNRQWNEANKKNESEPVINVTIGRVEVRAVQADPPRAKRKKKPTGVMSLDEYLNQRERRS